MNGFLFSLPQLLLLFDFYIDRIQITHPIPIRGIEDLVAGPGPGRVAVGLEGGVNDFILRALFFLLIPEADLLIRISRIVILDHIDDPALSESKLRQ